MNERAVLSTSGETNRTRGERKERVVFTNAHVVSGVYSRASLANDDATCTNALASKNLNA